VPLEQDGVLLVDKPAGLTSAGVIRVLKHRFKPKKIGHGGTLDPFATGLLVVLIGKATKLSSLFLEGDKSYSGIIRLGLATDTEDITGSPVETDENVSEKFRPERWRELQARVKENFIGELEQVPPRYSALKVDGKRSYELARKGLEFEHPSRRIEITELRLEFKNPSALEFFVRCSKGTYVRSLARDIGKFLESCACLETLRRESSSGFEINETLELDSISAENITECLISPEVILDRLRPEMTESLVPA